MFILVESPSAFDGKSFVAILMPFSFIQMKKWAFRLRPWLVLVVFFVPCASVVAMSCLDTMKMLCTSYWWRLGCGLELVFWLPAMVSSISFYTLCIYFFKWINLSSLNKNKLTTNIFLILAIVWVPDSPYIFLCFYRISPFGLDLMEFPKKL